MKFRFTIQECREWSDRRFLAALVTERRSGLNPHTPLADRLAALTAKLTQGKPLTK